MANILDLDPFAFDAALQELGIPEEEQARLREQYRQKNSPLSGVKEALAPQEGRNTSEFFPVSVPEGKSVAEGVMSGDWEWAVPEALSGGVNTALEGVEAPGQILSGVPYSKEEMGKAAFQVAPFAAPLNSLRNVLERERTPSYSRQTEEAFDTEFETFPEEAPKASTLDDEILEDLDYIDFPNEVVPKQGDLDGAVGYLAEQINKYKAEGYGDWKDDQKSEFLSYPKYQDWLKDAAEKMPHYNDDRYFDFLEEVSLFASKEGFAPTAIQELIFDLSPWTTPKKDPEKAFFAEVEMPYAAPVGERAANQARPDTDFPPRPSDPKAEALGFNEHVYHTTTSPREFNKFDLSMGIIPGEKRAAQDYLGVHVGTPRAAGERFVSTKTYREKAGRDTSGFTMELRARTDKPASIEALTQDFGFDFSQSERPKDATPNVLTEDELNIAIRQYADKIFGPDLPEDAYELAAIAWRRDLASRGYTHIPYINDIEDPTSTSYIMLVDRPKNSPAVLRDVRAKFDPKKVNNPDLRFAEGGMVQGNNMEQDMTKLFAEGGVNTGEAEVDPVSGNEVPPGSMPEEVRDDVDAKLSGGEYVVPADVLRFYGVAYFERLRKKAKEALAEMDQEGRIGGDKEEAPEMEQEEEDDDLPFDDDELMFEDDGEEMAFAEGGVVPPGGIKTFEPNQYFAGFSAFNGLPTQPQAETRTYVNAQGQRVSIQFINGQPQQPIPAGFYPEGQVPTTAQNTAVAPNAKPERPNADEQRSKTRQNTEKGLDWGAGKDWSKMSADEAVSLATSRLGGNKVMSGIAQGLGALNPIAGLAAGAAVNLRPFAEANGIEKALRASGNTTAADAVAGLVDTRLSESKIGIRTLEPLLANGTQVAKTLLNATAQNPAQVAGKTGGTAAGRTLVKNGDRSGGTGPAKGPIAGPTGGSSQKKGAAPAKARASSKPASNKSAPSKSTSSKATSSRQSHAGRAGFEKGGLVTRRKK